MIGRAVSCSSPKLKLTCLESVLDGKSSLEKVRYVQASHKGGVRAGNSCRKNRLLLAGQSVCGLCIGGTLDGFAPFFGLVPESVK